MTKHFLVPKRSIFSPPTFFRGVGQEFDEVFDSLFTEFFSDKQCLKDKISNKVQYPKADVFFCEKTNNLVFDIAVPGVKKEDIEVSLEDSVLTVSFEKEKLVEKEKEVYLKRELKRSSFQRIWELNQEELPIDYNKEVTSCMSNGILKISIPIDKPKKIEKRKITIKQLE